MGTEQSKGIELKTPKLREGESSGLLDKKHESAPLSNLPSGGTPNEPLQKERIEVRVDPTGNTRSPKNDKGIFDVVARGDHKALSKLLITDTTSVCAIDKEGNTALHRAVASACQKGDSDYSFYQCIDLLMSCEQMNVNMPNKNGYTAIGLAVHHLNRTCVDHMLKHPSADRLYLDSYPGDSESTVREIIVETYPDLEPLPEPLMESLDSSDRDIKLLAALQRDEYNIFRETLDSNNPNPWYDEPYHSSLLEIACQMKKREKFAGFLLDNDADPYIKNRVTGMPLIHATARNGNFVLLKILLEKLQEKEINIISLKDNEDRTILHWLARLRERKQEDKRSLQDCLNRLLSPDCRSKVGTEDRDLSGNTALYIAVELGFRDRAKVLLSKGADVRVFERGSKILLSANLSIVKEILDESLLNNKKPLSSKDLKLWLNYQSFMEIVPRIAQSELHRDLLKHPVMSTFLILKWENVKFVFLSDVFFYSSFLLSLTSYILLSEPYNTLNDGGAASNTTGPLGFNDSNIESGMNDSKFTSQHNSSSLVFLWLFLNGLLFLLTLRELLQLFVHRWVYVKSLENWLEISLVISTFISCSGVVESAVLKRHCSAIALLLGWSEMLMLLGRLPQLSVQHEMLRTVILTFLRFMAGYVTLLIAFALSFYILFKGSSDRNAEMFANPPISLLKTIVMFTGEYDASDLSFEILPYTSHVIFLLFVVLVAIVLLNLLNGLAVNDTEVIRKDAERLSLAARAKLISRIEELVNVLPQYIKPDIELKKEMFEIYPNKWNRIDSAAVRSLLSIISEEKPNKKDKSTGTQAEWSFFAKKLSALELRQEKLEEKLHSTLDESRQMFGQILARLNIPECEITHHEF